LFFPKGEAIDGIVDPFLLYGILKCNSTENNCP